MVQILTFHTPVDLTPQALYKAKAAIEGPQLLDNIVDYCCTA